MPYPNLQQIAKAGEAAGHALQGLAVSFGNLSRLEFTQFDTFPSIKLHDYQLAVVEQIRNGTLTGRLNKTMPEWQEFPMERTPEQQRVIDNLKGTLTGRWSAKELNLGRKPRKG
jgi:hypothetical protein